MQDVQQLPELRVPKWPFFLADALMLGLAYYLFYWQVNPKLPLSQWEVIACCVCVFLAALLGVTPFLLEYRAVFKYGALMKLIETNTLTAAAEKIQNLEGCVSHINNATEQLQAAQTQADKTAQLAGQITDRMAQEVREFTEFMQKSNDGEKATLRLEVEKLRRSESEWLSVLVFMLDHIFALNKAAERSGQENLIKQLSHFQSACRDAARRVGLIPVLALPGDAFDAQRHQVAEGEVPAAGLVEEVLVSGYSFQGKLIRSAVVSLASLAPAESGAAENSAAAAAPQTPVPLGGRLSEEA